MTLTAIPAKNAFLSTWGGDIDCSSKTTVTEVNLASSKECIAFFHLKPHQLTLSQTGEGQGTVGTDVKGDNLIGGDVQCQNDCYKGGSVVTLIANPAADSSFAGWTGDDDCTDGKVTLDSEKNCVAIFKLLPTYSLTLATTGNGSGTVTPTVPGANCGATCSRYLGGTAVTLLATPAPDSMLTGWTGDCNSETVTMNADKQCVAIFTHLPTYTLTVTPSGTGKGTITNAPLGNSCGNECMIYLSGTTVTLTALPEVGTTVTAWSETCPNGQVLMDADKQCTVTFTAATSPPPITDPNTPPPVVTYTLTVTKAGTGQGEVTTQPAAGVNCDSGCAYNSDTAVTLTATALTGSVFAGWSGDCDNEGKVTLAANKHCTATFNLLPVLTVSLSGQGLVTSEPAGLIECGQSSAVNSCVVSGELNTVVTLVTAPAPGFKFITWHGDADCQDGQVTLDKNKQCVAMFEAFSRLQLSQAVYQVQEDEGNLTVTVSRVGSSARGQVAVTYTTTDGSALAGVDYTLTTGKLIWEDGDSRDKTFMIPILPDNVPDGNKTLTIQLVAPEGDVTLGIPTTAELTIIDVPWFVSLQFASPTYTSQAAEGKVMLLVTRAGSAFGEVALDFATTDGTALANQDYMPTMGTLTWASGDRGHKIIEVLLPNLKIWTPESLEKTLLVNLANATNGAVLGQPVQATVNIAYTVASTTTLPSTPAPGTEIPSTEEPPATTVNQVGVINFSSSTYQVNENDGNLTMTVVRAGGNYGAITVNYATEDDTAVAGSEYLAAKGVLQWADGEEGAKQFSISLLDDTIMEEAKSFKVVLNPDLTTLEELSNLNPNLQAIVTINDDDLASAQFSSSHYVVPENSAEVVITVTRQGNLLGDMSVNYVTANGTAKSNQDYSAVSGTLTWFSGDNSAQTFVIPLLFDLITEGNETFQVRLTDGTGKVKLGIPSEATITIAEDDLSGCQIATIINCFLDNSANSVPLTDVQIGPRGVVVGGSLSGQVQNSGLIQDVNLLLDTMVVGGTIGGYIKGNAPLPKRPLLSPQPTILTEVQILPNSLLEHLIIDKGTVLDDTVTLGEGVLFADNSLIPYHLDLSRTLGRQATSVLGQQATLLTGDVLRWSAIGGILGAINDLYALKNAGLVLTQQANYGYLSVDIEQVRYAVLPLQVRQVINNHRSDDPEAAAGMTLAADGTVTWVTHTGREVVAYPVIQAPAALQDALRAWNLTADMQLDGIIKVPTTEGAFFMARPNLYSIPVSQEQPLGLNVTSPISLIFDDEAGIRRQQLIYPAPADTSVLADQSNVIGNDGRVSLQINNRTYQGMLDYLATSGTRATIGQLEVIDAGDLNGDGLNDYQLIYPNGVKQLLFGM